MSKKPTTKDLEQQLAQLTDALQRERADAENIRRRHNDQLGELQTFAKVQVVQQLLPAIDNLERALKHTPIELEGSEYVKGVQGVAKQYEKVFADLGVERIKTVGEVFDPILHEAVGMEDGDGDHEVVCEELQPGYKLNGEVVRHAMVKVKPGVKQ